MINEICEFNKVLTNLLCDEIIENVALFNIYNESSINHTASRILSNGLRIDAMHTKDHICNDLSNETIIRQYNDFDFIQYEIPKKNKEWYKIETILYNQLLIHLNKYKQKLIIHESNCNLYSLLNNKLKLSSFYIQKYKSNNSDVFIRNFNRTNNRYNILSFVFFLNDGVTDTLTIINNGSIHTVYPKKGNLIIFSENIDYTYKYKLHANENLYIITGQLFY